MLVNFEIKVQIIFFIFTLIMHFAKAISSDFTITLKL